MNKRFALLLILILTASSLIVVKPAHSSIHKPSVPEFTVELVDSSYDVPTTYSIAPYTGENVTYTGYHVECRTIVVTIKNQPFVPYYDNSSGWNINFYYNIRIKGHFSEVWWELNLASDGYPTQDSGSEYTVFSYQGEYSSTEGMKFKAGSIITTFPPDAQVDFQVEAMIGYVHRSSEPPWFPYIFTGEKSGWSETQTLTISEQATKPPTEPPPEDSTTEPFQPTWIVATTVIVTIAVVGVAILVYFRRIEKKRELSDLHP